jgi:hypothetical protein
MFKEISNTYGLEDWIRCIGQVGLSDPALWLHQFHFKRTSAHPNCSTSCNQRGSLKLFFAHVLTLLAHTHHLPHSPTLHITQLPTYLIHPSYLSTSSIFKSFFLLSNMAIIIAIRRKSFWWYHQCWNLRGRVVSRLGLVANRNNPCAIFKSTLMYINWKGEI